MFGRLIFDSQLEEFFYKNSYDKIDLLLINGDMNVINEIGNYIKREGDDTVSYLPKSKYDKIINSDGSFTGSDPYSNGIGRVTVRIGRFAAKFLRRSAMVSFNISDRDIEKFVNIYKSYFIRTGEFKIVEGDEILKWYLEDNYHQIDMNQFGPLWNSCMRQKERNKFMSLYAKNDSIKMLILLDEDQKLLARAILWENAQDDDGNYYKIMDRIYTIYDHDVILFKEWARKNGYLHKTDQSSRSERYITKYNADEPISLALNLSVKLENHVLSYYPYLDTFKFYNPFDGLFSNSDESKFKYILVQSNGGLVPPPPPEPEEDYEEEMIDDWNDH